MDEPVENENDDAWVLARITALERGNRRLWTALGALGMLLVSICLAVVLFAASVELPDGTTLGSSEDGEGLTSGDLTVDDMTVRGALRVVDDRGRNLVFIGPEPAQAGTSAVPGQTVIGLFAGAAEAAPQQTVRLATSPRGSALALSTPDGARSASVFAGENGASVELRRGDATRVISQQPDASTAAPAGAAEPVTVSTGERAETPTVASPTSGEGGRGPLVDLSDPSLHPLGNGFYVGRLTLSDEHGGLRVSGRLVNASSVDQLRAEFRLLVGGRELPFTVAKISAGSSTGFAVEIPASDPASLRTARMRWVRSTVSYLSD
jgi:hypothetical protein